MYPIAAPDLSAYVANLQKAGADGVIGWIANVPNAAMIFNAMKTLAKKETHDFFHDPRRQIAT